MLIARHGRDVLVRLRPGSGIWGGLWSLPEIALDAVPFDAEAAEDAALEAVRPFGEPARAYLAGELTHVFTHFRLLIRAIRVDLTAAAPRLDADSRWLSLDDLDALGTPAPVRRLLEDQARIGLF